MRSVLALMIVCGAWSALVAEAAEGKRRKVIYADDAEEWRLEPYAGLAWYGRHLQGPRLEADLEAGTVTTLNPDWGHRRYCYGCQDGPLAGAQFSWIMMGFCDIEREKDVLYVADSWNKRLRFVFG